MITIQTRRAGSETRHTQRPCGSCGATPTYLITLRGQAVPACLRHLNVWRTPAPDYTCPTACVEQNHPGREHAAWLTPTSEPTP